MGDDYTAPGGGLTYTFAGGSDGSWRIDSIVAVNGAPLPGAPRLSITTNVTPMTDPVWRLRGFTSNARYSRAAELKQLATVSPPLGRPEATLAALIPIRKTAAWWAMGQDVRRTIFEDQSKHIAQSLRHLPAVARRLHHARDLGEPFDFLTWFEYAPDYAADFENFLAEMRATAEWHYVEREVDIRLVRD